MKAPDLVTVEIPVPSGGRVIASFREVCHRSPGRIRLRWCRDFACVDFRWNDTVGAHVAHDDPLRREPHRRPRIAGEPK